MAPALIRVGAKAVIVRDGQVLLVRYEDANGIHYNFPGGGIDKGESIRKGLRREVHEETNLQVKVGRLLLAAEYEPKKHDRLYGRIHKLTLYFQCEPKEDTQPQEGGEPSVPAKPDQDQVGVEWFPLQAMPDKLIPHHHELIVAALDEIAGRKLFTTSI